MNIHTVKGIIRYSSVVEPSGAKGFDRKYWGITLLVKKDDPQIEALKKIMSDAVKNSTVKVQELSQKKEFTWPLEQLNEAEGPLSDYYQVRIRTASEDREGKPRKRPSTHVLNEKNRHTLLVTDPQFDSECIGRIAHVGFNCDAWDTAKGGVNFYYYCGLVSDSLTGELDPESLKQKVGVTDIFANVIGTPVQTEEEAIFDDVIHKPAAPAKPVPPRPVAPPKPAALPKHQMTAKAEYTYDQYKDAGWSDEQLITEGLMLPPGGITPDFLG